ncbi:MAG: FkbM family methyltransferase [Vicinamibacterales bacterium]
MRSLLHALIWTRRHLAGQLPARELTPLLRCLAPDDLFLDVGVHAGSWTIPASRVLRAGHVYAFEALPYYGKVLKSTLALLRRLNVTVVVGAVSDAAGEVSIVWKDAAGRRLTGMTHISRGREAGESVRVRALTIDGFLRDRPGGRVRLMKCDVEGAELMVLRGSAATIDRWRPLVFCELYESYCAQYGYSTKEVFDFFVARDYRCAQFDGGTYHLLEPAAYSGEGDVLFVPRETGLPPACG